MEDIIIEIKLKTKRDCEPHTLSFKAPYDDFKTKEGVERHLQFAMKTVSDLIAVADTVA